MQDEETLEGGEIGLGIEIVGVGSGRRQSIDQENSLWRVEFMGENVGFGGGEWGENQDGEVGVGQTKEDLRENS